MKKVLSLLTIACFVLLIVVIQGCKKATIPVLTTTEVTGITNNAAVSGGNITSDGGDDILEKGVCWNTTGEPTIADAKTSDGEGSGDFTSNLSGLLPSQNYSVRAYATNSAGTSYGEELSFYTKIADVEGNQYTVVKIGSQMWMAENLKTTKYKDNSQIPNITGDAAWAALTTHAYCWYENNAATNKPLYGAIYNWYAVNSGKLCPTGWHVPTDAEYNTMELSLGVSQAQIDLLGWRGTDQGKQLKNTIGWSAGQNGTNTSGFAALPGGYRNHSIGAFNGQNVLSYWWSSSDDSANGKPDVCWYRRLDGDNNGVYKASTNKPAGKYVRCVKD